MIELLHSMDASQQQRLKAHINNNSNYNYNNKNNNKFMLHKFNIHDKYVEMHITNLCNNSVPTTVKIK